MQKSSIHKKLLIHPKLVVHIPACRLKIVLVRLVHRLKYTMYSQTSREESVTDSMFNYLKEWTTWWIFLWLGSSCQSSIWTVFIRSVETQVLGLDD